MTEPPVGDRGFWMNVGLVSCDRFTPTILFTSGPSVLHSGTNDAATAATAAGAAAAAGAATATAGASTATGDLSTVP